MGRLELVLYLDFVVHVTRRGQAFWQLISKNGMKFLLKCLDFIVFCLRFDGFEPELDFLVTFGS